MLHRIDTASVHFTENTHTTTNDDPQFTGHQQESSYTTVLPTAIVSVIDSQNKLVQCRGLLDSGSELSFITEKLADALNLNKDDVNLNLSGIGGKAKDVKAGGVKLVLKSGLKQVNVSAYILKQLTISIPSKLLKVPTASTNISLADPNFNVSKPVDMILGADVFEELMETQRRKISLGLFLRKTIFGWVLLGKQNESTTSFISCHASIDEILRKFWEVKTLPQRKMPTEEELLCEKIYQETTRVVDNRFVVELPFKKDAILAESLTQAQRRFSSLERRLDTNPELRKRYGDFVDEFVSRDHMEVVPEDEINKPDSDVYYIPHHCVFKDSTTTKLRVVFDGSAKTSNGLSLNKSLMVGPVVQNLFYYSESIPLQPYSAISGHCQNVPSGRTRCT